MKKILYTAAIAFALVACTKQEANFDEQIRYSSYIVTGDNGDTLAALYVPSGFTPNGDGINDLFYGTGSGMDPGSFALSIFDRYGDLVFLTNYINKAWEGKVNGGKDPGPAGPYNAQFEFSDTLGGQHLFNQRILLVK